MKVQLVIVLLIMINQLFAIPEWVSNIDFNVDELEYSKKADCIVFLNEEEITIKNAESAKAKTKIAVKILNWDGLDLAKITREMNKGDKCSIKGWRFTKEKEWVTLPKTSIHEISLSNYSFYYDDTYIKAAAFQNVIPGDIIVFEVEETIKNWSVSFQDFVFQKDQPTIKTKYSITIPDGWQIKKTKLNMEPFQHNVEKNTYIWEASNLRYQESEPFPVDWDYLTRSIKLVAINSEETKYSFKNWESISKWYFQQCSDKLKSTIDIQTTVNEITSGSTTNFEKCGKIADYVKSKIRYVAIEIGKDRIIPRPASKTLQNGFGDCKDKAILMISMLSDIGIVAYPVLVNTQSPVEESLPTPFQFNHCIVGIPADQFESEVQTMGFPKILYFDPTDKYSIWGNTVEHLFSENVLICSEEPDLNIITLPLQNPSNNKKKYITIGKVNENGSFSARSKIVYSYNQIPNALFMITNKSEDEMIEELSYPINDILKNVEISQVEKKVFTDSVVINYKIKGNGIVRNSDQFRIFYPNIYANRYPVSLSDKIRNTPVFWGKFKDYTYKVKWELPETWKLEEKIVHDKSACIGENIEMDIQIGKTAVSMKLRQISLGKTIPISDYTSAVKYEYEKKQMLNYTLLIPFGGLKNDTTK